MRSTFFLTALFTLFATAFAQDNAFTFPIENGTYEVGSTINLQWANASGSTVDLLLKTGDPSNLQTYATIGSNVPNQGSVAWTIPTNIPTGNYAFELINNDDPNDINYSTFIYIHNPQAVTSSVTATSESVGGLSTAAPNTSTSAVSSSAPVVATTSANSTSVATTSSASSSSAAVVPPAGGVNGSTTKNTTTSGKVSSKASGKETKTGKSTQTGGSSSSASGSASGSASASSSKANAGMVNTWSVGGVVGAIGAVALML